MTQSQYKYPFEPASQDRLFNIEGYTAHMFKELMLARRDLFNETNNTIEKFAAKYPNVDIRTFRHGFVDKVSDKKAANEGIPRLFIKCNKNNQHAIAFVPTVWCDQHFWNQPEPVVEQPVVASVIDVSVVEVLAETETVLEEEVVPPNVSIPEPDPIPPPTASNLNQTPPTKIFNGREFYCANELKEKYPQIFRGLKKGNIRDIIRKLDIPKDTECVYAMLVKKDWKLMSESVDKAKLFISKDWWDEKMLENSSTSSGEEVKVKSKYDMAPPVIEVPENVMFKDPNGEPILIQIRGHLINGQLDKDNLYFNLDDISQGFKIPNIYQTVIREDRKDYIDCHHYKKYFVNNYGKAKVANGDFCLTREIGVQVFLTFLGICKLLFSTDTPNALQFQAWAINILFTHQFGSKEQKQELASHLVGVSYSDYKMIFDTNASAFPCIYIIIIGLVSKLRKKYKIPEKYPDNDLVLKFGKADDFKTRLPQHACRTNYGPNIKVLHTQQIDVIHVKSAETALKDYFYGRILDIPTEKQVDKENDKEFISEGKKELFVMSDTKSDNEWLQTILKRIGENYAGRTKEFKHQLELKDVTIEYLTKDVNEKNKTIAYFQSK